MLRIHVVTSSIKKKETKKNKSKAKESFKRMYNKSGKLRKM